MADLAHANCGGCGHVFSDPAKENAPGSDRMPCPNCGSSARRFGVAATATAAHHASVAGIAYTLSKTRWFAKFWSGQRSWFGATGRWHVRYRHMDRRSDAYDEVYLDEKTGVVVHENHEPLPKHRGHGSAKTPQPEKPGG